MEERLLEIKSQTFTVTAAPHSGEVVASGKIKSDCSSGTSDCFSASLSGNTNAIIRADGTVRIGGTVGSTPNIDLSLDGSATAGDVIAGDEALGTSK